MTSRGQMQGASNPQLFKIYNYNCLCCIYIREDYYAWNEGFTATHKLLGSVVGNEDGEITCYPIGNVLKELEQSFNENVDCTLGQFDTWDI